MHPSVSGMGVAAAATFRLASITSQRYFFYPLRGRDSGRSGNVVGERRERRAGGGFGAVRRDLGPRGGKSRGCAGRSTPGAKQTWSRTHQEFGVIFAVPGFSRPLGLSLSHCGNRRLPGCVPAAHGRSPPKARPRTLPQPMYKQPAPQLRLKPG